jgi:hypothetical protein
MRWLLPIFIFAGMALFIWRLIEGTPHLETVFLADRKNNWQSKVFTCPKGKNFSVVLGIPPSTTTATENFTGSVVLFSNETPVAEIPFETAQSTEASWLNKYQLRAYVLNWPTNSTGSRLDRELIPGNDYKVKVNFRVLSPTGSVWLVFTATQQDKRKP